MLSDENPFNEVAKELRGEHDLEWYEIEDLMAATREKV